MEKIKNKYKKLILILIIVVLLGWVSIVIYSSIFCLKEGEILDKSSGLPVLTGFSIRKCCKGLEAKHQSAPGGKDICLDVLCRCYVCLKCGNKICEEAENFCTCPEDCKKEN